MDMSWWWVLQRRKTDEVISKGEDAVDIDQEPFRGNCQKSPSVYAYAQNPSLPATNEPDIISEPKVTPSNRADTLSRAGLRLPEVKASEQDQLILPGIS